jgi:hypothetical protein
VVDDDEQLLLAGAELADKRLAGVDVGATRIEGGSAARPTTWPARAAAAGH